MSLKFKLLKNTLDKNSKTITLTEKHLGKRIFNDLKFGSISPNNILFKHFHSDVKVTISKNSLNRTKAKVIFLYQGKEYLIIYNK